MRRSMKRLKTFKRPNEGTTSDPNAIPLESIGGKIIQFCFFLNFKHFSFVKIIVFI